MKKLCMTVMLAIALALAALSAAAESVKYIDADGMEQWSPDTTIIIDSNSYSNATDTIYWHKDNWYAVEGEVEVNQTIRSLATVHLILCDGATLKVNWGIQVERDGSNNPGNLTIYAQSSGSDRGKLIADNSGRFNAAGIVVDAGEGASLTINGGVIVAKGGEYAAGIGGYRNVSCGTVTIHGGMVSAVSSAGGGAGIGGGCAGLEGPTGDRYLGTAPAGGNVTITGGTVFAQGSEGAPAIGAGLGTGTPNHGTLTFMPRGNYVCIARANGSVIDAFQPSQENRVSSLSSKAKVSLSMYWSNDLTTLLSRIDALPDPDSYTPGDSDVDQRILDAKKAFDSLKRDEEKSFASIARNEKLARLLGNLGKIILLEGDGQRVTVGTTAPMSFCASGPLAWFTGILVDGKAVDRDCYTSKAGSTVVTLNPGYVATLTAGTHTLTFQYSNGETVTAGFEVVAPQPTPTPEKVDVEAAQLPQTGDRSSLLLWAVLALLCAGGAAVPWARDRRK